jgi:phosphoribosylaminoimidazolecarboxamide formyltransferase/IMP cyclohydrolase
MALTALLSVSDKTGIVDSPSALHAPACKLLSTGGTAGCWPTPACPSPRWPR